ncbi:hypothetical protein HPP92_004213 [Vanilla planifolia]|uniref:Uncharacterized protein n=1 Tax=Vanilla planifolia TaxID=51239 RepID=A0A835VHX4_VANPL|nr:hypothetical protein HPP92_004213 [Vanilla planifolia]
MRMLVACEGVSGGQRRPGQNIKLNEISKTPSAVRTSDKERPTPNNLCVDGNPSTNALWWLAGQTGDIPQILDRIEPKSLESGSRSNHSGIGGSDKMDFGSNGFHFKQIYIWLDG